MTCGLWLWLPQWWVGSYMQQATGKEKGYRSSSLGKCEEGSKTQLLEASMKATQHTLPTRPFLPHSICTVRDAQNHAILVSEEQRNISIWLRCGWPPLCPTTLLWPFWEIPRVYACNQQEG